MGWLFDKNELPDCIYPGKHLDCGFYFEGKCGAHPEYPPGYNYPKMEWRCVFDLPKQEHRDNNEPKRKNTKKREKPEPAKRSKIF